MGDRFGIGFGGCRFGIGFIECSFGMWIFGIRFWDIGRGYGLGMIGL